MSEKSGKKSTDNAKKDKSRKIISVKSGQRAIIKVVLKEFVPSI